MAISSRQAMEMAIQEAKKGWGHVAPNPPVGCVILDSEGELLSTGYHQEFGGVHAEIDALNRLENHGRLKGAHVFVTLEPCSHEGKTPSCAKKLASLPIETVIYGLQDPNPQVSGQGAQILRDAGKIVGEFGDLANELEQVAEIFFHNMKNQMPFVALKVATSMDGCMGLKNGESQWITNELSRKKSHFLRGCYDSILVGSNTILHDDPKLNIRHESYPNKENKVIILDPQGKTFDFLKESNLLKVHAPQNIFIVTSDKLNKKPPSGLNHLSFPSEEEVFDLKALLKELYQAGVSSIYVEGGGHTYSQFFSQKLAQRIYHFLAPCILGGVNGVQWTSLLEVNNMEHRIQLKQTEIEVIGNNVLFTGLLP